MKPIEDTTKHWTAVASKLLRGRMITGVRYMTPKEAERLMWSTRSVVLELDNGMLIYPSHDDEGNDAGAMFTTSKTVPTLPVLR